MSGAVEAVQVALLAALGAVDGLALFDGPPARAAFPYAAVGEAVSGDWSVKDRRGREVRTAIAIWDDGQSAARLHVLMAAAEDAIEAMARDLAGWRVASLVLLRARIRREADGPWAGTIEYRVRVLETA